MSPSVTCYASAGKAKSVKWCRAFARGCGGRVVADWRPRPGPAALYGKAELWPLLARLRAEDCDWWYGDNGYFGRGHYRVTRGALQHSGIGAGDPTRLRRLGVEIRPWRRGGRHVLVCPPGAVFARLNGFSATAWLEETKATLARHSDRPVVVRVKASRDRRPLEADLEGAHALVAHSSNAAVLALCAGVPVFVTAPCAASAMASGPVHWIETPAYPEGREDWAACLAANQWTLEELTDGTCWRAIGL